MKREAQPEVNIYAEYVWALISIWAIMASAWITGISTVLTCLSVVTRVSAGYILFSIISDGLRARIELERLSAKKNRPI